MSQRHHWQFLLAGAVVLFTSGGFWVAATRAEGNNDLSVAAKSGNVQEVKRLLANGANVNGRDNSRSTPLHYAAGAGEKALVELLIAKGADIHAKGQDSVTPLYLAAKFNRPEVAELLIARGADVNAKTTRGFTPLTIAATEGNKAVAKVLLAHGADANAKDASGASPLFWTFKLLFTGYSVTATTPTALATQKGLDGATLERVRAAFRQSKGKVREMALLLMNSAADVNVEVGADTPLLAAANFGDRELVESLLNKGANVNGSRSSIETPLHAAIAERHRDVAELLIQKNANVNARNVSGRTPLHFLAANLNDGKLAALMIDHGADINAKDKNGQTPIGFATNAGNSQVAEMLRSRARP